MKKILSVLISIMILSIGIVNAEIYSETYETTSGGSSSNHLYIHRYVKRTYNSVYGGNSNAYYSYGFYGSVYGQSSISTTWNSMGMLSWSNSHTTFDYDCSYGSYIARTNSLPANQTQYLTYNFICATSDNYFGGTIHNEFNGIF